MHEHHCNQCDTVWVDKIMKSQCPRGCKNKGWALEAPEYPIQCIECGKELQDVDYGDGQIMEKCYCPACDTIIVEEEEYEPIHLKILEWSCIGIILAVVVTFIYAAIASYFGG